ncbi:DUF2514 family protein [Pseudomonas sp. NPDC089392]|uniref:DUF2514 family protein n=1 Tax=Pseudomonas sp. NPDC089392 TaxID=3364459 RepID=UPI0037F6F822
MFSVRAAREKEHRSAAAHQEAREIGHEERKIGAADVGAAGQRLRSDAPQVTDAVSCPGTDTAAVAIGATATRAAAMVLSDLISRSVQRIET